jgi:hypothetical protein
VLLWLRPDLAREQARAYWSGPHSRLAALTPGVREYRQHHFTADSRGAWPALDGVETAIDDRWRVDGTPEVTFEHVWSPLLGGRQVERIRRDERNAFARTLFHLTGPRGGRWLKSGYGAEVGSRVVVLLRRREQATLPEFVHETLGPALERCPGVLELRTQTFLPFVKYAWNTPGVAHDYPHDHRYHAAIVLGAADRPALEEALAAVNAELGLALRRQVTAALAYDVEQTFLFRRDGRPTKPAR